MPVVTFLTLTLSNTRGWSPESSPRRKVFDGMTVRSSLWHTSKANSSQMRWLPVAREAAGPCLQISGCATNQVIALSRVHPLQLGRTPSTSCAPRWGEVKRAAEGGWLRSLGILVKSQAGGARRLPPLQGCPLITETCTPNVPKNVFNNKWAPKCMMDKIK